MSTKRDNSGALFKNDRKEQETHADYRGDCLIGGQEFYMDAWLNTADSGRKYLSVRFKPKQAKQAEPPRQRPKDEKYRAGTADDSDIPF